MDTCTIHAVIALHGYVFRPYTGQPTAILILTKGKPAKEVWFYEITEDGFKKTASKEGRPANVDGENHLVELRSIWDEKDASTRSFSVSTDRIRNSAYKLSLSAYRTRNEPAHWVPLGGPQGVCHLVLGATPKTKVPEYWNDGVYPWVTISDMNERYVMRTGRKITSEGVAHSSVKLVPKGTVLVSFKLTMGKVAIAGQDLYTNEAIIGLVPKDDRVLSEYLYHIIPVLDFQSYAQPAAKGQTLNMGIIASIRIPLPSVREQQQFIDEMNRLEGKVMHLREQTKDLERESKDTVRTLLANC